MVDVGRVLHDYTALVDLGVDEGDDNILTGLSHVLRPGERERDEAHLRIAGFDELRGLSDVLRDYELRLHLIDKLQVLQRPVSCESKRRMQLIGDGDASDARVSETIQTDRLRGRVLPGPKDECAVGVLCGLLAVGKPGCDDLLREGEVGGEEYVKRRAVDDLCGQCARRAEGDLELHAGLARVGLSKHGHDRLKIGSGGDEQCGAVFLR